MRRGGSQMRLKLKQTNKQGLTLCPSWHELPKSTILIALLLGLHNKMFSGFKSQWIIFSSGVDRYSKAVHICWANFLVRFNETPLKFVFLSKSYKLYDKSSKTKHKWFLYMKCLLSRTVEKKKQRHGQQPEMRFLHPLLSKFPPQNVNGKQLQTRKCL